MVNGHLITILTGSEKDIEIDFVGIKVPGMKALKGTSVREARRRTSEAAPKVGETLQTGTVCERRGMNGGGQSILN